MYFEVKAYNSLDIEIVFKFNNFIQGHLIVQSIHSMLTHPEILKFITFSLVL